MQYTVTAKTKIGIDANNWGRDGWVGRPTSPIFEGNRVQVKLERKHLCRINQGHEFRLGYFVDGHRLTEAAQADFDMFYILDGQPFPVTVEVEE